MNDAGNAAGKGNGNGNANLPIGSLNKSEEARNADLPIGNSKQSEEANREIGGPGGPGGPWKSRGYLPHFDGCEATQHVTFHLADSLPRETIERIEEEMRAVAPDWQDTERRKRVEDWIDAGHGSCVLREPGVAALVQGAFLHFDGERYRLLAWVVMPNHVHVLFQPMRDWTVAKIVASWKKFTAREICDFRRGTLRNADLRNADLPIGNLNKSEKANQEIGGPGGPVWHREYWDRFIRNDRHFQQVVEYIHQNPVKAGLVERPQEWRWSSAFVVRGDGNSKEANREIGGPRGEP